jgi:hypothetical protein
MDNIMQYTQDFFAIVGGLYAFASLVGNLVPNTKIGQLFRKFAADLQSIEKLEGGTPGGGASAAVKKS